MGMQHRVGRGLERHATALAALAFVASATVTLVSAAAALRPVAARAADRGRGVASTEIVFGMTGPFSGPNQDLGQGVRAGVEAAFAAVNEAGGVHGRRLRLVTADDAYEPTRTAVAMRDLVEQQGVFGVVGAVGTAPAQMWAPYAAATRTPFFGALTGAPVLRRSPPERYVFNYRASYAEETAAAVRWLVSVRNVPPRQIAILAQQDGFGEAGTLGVVRQLAGYGVKPSEIVRGTYRRNSSDLTDALTAIAAAKDVKAVVMVASAHAAAEFVHGMRSLGRKVTYTNVSFGNADALAKRLVQHGAPFVEDLVVTQVVPLPTGSSGAAVRYRAALEKHARGEKPGFVSFEAYLAASVLVDGLRRAGPDLDREKLVGALEATTGLDLGTGAPISFTVKEHQASHEIWATALQPNGTWKAVDLGIAAAAR